MILEYVRTRGYEPVVPTVRMLRHWWPRINLEVFGGILMPCQLTYGVSGLKNVMGLCYALDGGRARIHIETSPYWLRCDLLATLAHEMVHQYQHQNGLPMTHGKSFKQWAAPIRRTTGLTI